MYIHFQAILQQIVCIFRSISLIVWFQAEIQIVLHECDCAILCASFPKQKNMPTAEIAKGDRYNEKKMKMKNANRLWFIVFEH